ncbi:glycosyltransferase family 2 protein [Rheinheimera sp. 1928-s]|uniref:glycosyltransferase family 2 protein n=1 Tax=Rheinheimera sp. 1928-s TaxID=3033803 RepID=UPI002629A08D|nr:glycosyltransferase family 2 protein [Rheinheimera sp. 1928-s]MDF3125685.1 glycosyltransferase family 2 protein [Rheinheimera sp. 1928-s]
MLISICMCTYKREHLRLTLQSIARLVIPQGVDVEVLVVDNDEQLSARATIDAFQGDFPHQLNYYSEPVKNISAARNKLLEKARGDWIASIDDDEVADELWLLRLKETADTYAADVVFGHVVPCYPDHTPAWIKEGNFFSRKTHETGTELSSGGSGCTLINRLFLEKNNMKFDVAYGTTGGEDAQLFFRMFCRGAKLVFCKDAIVYEGVESDRLNLSYLKKRALRVGQTYARYRLEQATVAQKLWFTVKNMLLLICISIVSLFSYPVNKQLFLKLYLKALDKYGKVACVFSGAKVELYK